MKVVLISTYELGRQPFGLASPAAWLRARGHDVTCADLSVSPLPLAQVRTAELVALYLPMHTATRLAGQVVDRVRGLNEHAHLVAYGLYAPLNAEYLRSLGVLHIIGGEFEAALVDIADHLATHHSRDLDPPAESTTIVPLDRLQFVVPDRAGLPNLNRYARLSMENGGRTVGYTEASRGCKHLCRHCPVVPVYGGVFRVVQQDVVIEDIRRQVAAGAGHITFGDPDFWNGPTHAIRIVEALHREWPTLSYDVTIKVEHLLKHRDLITVLKKTGCLFVTSAVESVDDEVLKKLDKGHTTREFYQVVDLFQRVGLTLAPTFIAFLPWTTRESYLALLRSLRELDLVGQVSPIQLALRLLITANSRLLELEDVREQVGVFDQTALAWSWTHRDPDVDQLAKDALKVVTRGQKANKSRRVIFESLWELARGEQMPDQTALLPRAATPYLNEPWYC